MPAFSRYVAVTIVRDAGSPQETRWDTHAGGDLVHNLLLHPPDAVRTGDEIFCAWFDEPRVVTRVDPKILSHGLAWWEATIVPRSEWERINQHQPGPPVGARVDTQTGDVGRADATGHSPELHRQQPTPEKAIFRIAGDICTAAFKERTIQFLASVGTKYIAELLRRKPHTPVGALQLAGATAEVSNLVPLSGIPVTDERTLIAVRDEISRTQAELGRLPANDWMRRPELERKLAQMQEYIQESATLRGQSREVAGVQERARKSVSIAIKRAIDEISGQHPELAQHLRESIDTGSELVYRPAVPIEWQF